MFKHIASVLPFVAGNADTVFWIGNAFVFVDHVTHGQCMALVFTENDGFVEGIDVFQNSFGNQFGALFCNDFSVVIDNGEFLFCRFSFQYFVAFAQFEFINAGFDDFQAIGSQKAVVDTVFQGIFKDRFSEIVISIDIVITLWGRCHAKMDSTVEVFKNIMP